jgi:hypothetical protein
MSLGPLVCGANNDAPDLIRARLCEGASILFFPGLGEHKESHLGRFGLAGACPLACEAGEPA